MHDGQNRDNRPDPDQDKALNAAEFPGMPALERASDEVSEHADAERESSLIRQSSPEAAVDAPEAEQLEIECDEQEDHGQSREGLQRGADLTPDELGVSRVIEVPVDYVSEVSFEDLGLPQVLLEGVQSRGYVRPTPVQAAAYSRAVEGKDLIVRSKTGTGKTAAFMLPVFTRIPAGDRRTRAIVLAPTRELAIQVADEGIALAQYKDVSVVPIYGGVGLGLQAEQLRAGAEVVVGTPGRVLDHLRRGNLDLSQALVAVLDEADEMLSMGFLEEVKAILKYLPSDHQTLLFSATIDASVAGLINRFMKDPEEIMLSTDVRTVEHIRNILYDCSDAYPKARSLLYLLYLENPESAIIFCNTRDDCSFVTAYLNRQGFDAEFINSDLPQRERERVMNRIKRGELAFLVATDIAARGIDISDLTHVINYSLPEDPDLYLHRVGRTGRIGKLGTAISLVSGRDLTAELALSRRLKIPFERRTLPSAEEASHLWTEKHLVKLREAADATAYEAFVPMVKEMMKTLSEEERARLFATTLRVFFAWSRTSRYLKGEDQEDVSPRDSEETEARGERRESRGREEGRRGRREGRGREYGDHRRERDGSGPEARRDERRRDDRGRSEAPAEGSAQARRDDQRRRPEQRLEGRRDERRRDERRRDDAPATDTRRGEYGRGEEQRRTPPGGDRARGARDDRRGRQDRVTGEARNGAPRGGDRQRETPTRPPEDILDPLAAFAAANDLDLDAWIEAEDFEEAASQPSTGALEGAPGNNLETTSGDTPDARKRRRGGRRRRRGRRGDERQKADGARAPGDTNDEMASSTVENYPDTDAVDDTSSDDDSDM